MTRFRAMWRRGIVWAMVPLAVFAGVPTSRCLCAAGERPAACQCRCCSGKPIADGASRSECCCGCRSCCVRRGGDASKRSPAQQPSSAPRSACCLPAVVGPNDATSRCCVEVAADPCVVSASVTMPNTSILRADIAGVAVELPPTFHSSVAMESGHCHVGPGADLVVRLRAFLI